MTTVKNLTRQKLDIRYRTANQLAQLVQHRSAKQKVSGSNQLKRKCCLRNEITQRLDFLVFSDKDIKPQALSRNPCSYDKFCETLKNPHTVHQEYGM